jgi:hypothetical protein
MDRLHCFDSWYVTKFLNDVSYRPIARNDLERWLCVVRRFRRSRLYSEITPRIRLEKMTKPKRSFSQNSRYSLPKFRVVVPITKLYLYTNSLDNCNVLTFNVPVLRGLRRKSAAARLLRLWVRIPPGAWMFVVVSFVCCQIEVSATSWSTVQRSPTDWRVVVCDLETSWMRGFWLTGGCRAQNNPKTLSCTEPTAGIEFMQVFHFHTQLFVYNTVMPFVGMKQWMEIPQSI